MKSTKFFKIFFITLSVFCFKSQISFSQTTRDWISKNQDYYTLDIGKRGIYRISYSSMAASGIPVGTLNPQFIRVFKNGIEQFIYIQGESDGRFDDTDFIEFYATGNDGFLDTELYKSSSDQPNIYQSLFSDTSTYYLTWGNTPSNYRMASFYNNNYLGKTSDTSFMDEKIISFKDYFFQGIPNQNSSSQHFSEYEDGEGFGRWIWASQSEFKLDLPKIHSNGPKAILEVLAHSANHNIGEISGGYNHNFAVALNSKENVLASSKALGYQRIQIQVSLEPTDLNESNSLYIGEKGYPQSAYVLSYIKCKYPRLLNLDETSEYYIQDTFTNSFFHFHNFNQTKNSPYIFDLIHHHRVKADKQNDHSIQFNLPQNGPQSFYIFDESDVIPITQLKPIKLGQIEINPQTNYLIITNTKLKSSAEDYKSYRSSNEGGNHQVTIAFVEDIYHEYGYGMAGPIAIKKFIESLHTNAPDLKHILLLGKGQTYDRIRTNELLKNTLNLVPSIGLPPSDYLYVSSLDGSSLATDYSIGRIPAKNNEQVTIYLDKLKAFESQPPALWQKKVIQIAGGNGSENLIFKNYLSSYYSILTDTAYGGFRVLFSKSEPLPIQTSLTGKIIKEINEGSNMLMYFGHGAAQVTEISLGEPSEYDNYGKTPLFFFNGCALGNTFEDISLAEKFLFEPRKGALGWIASTNLSYTSQLYRHTLEIHKKLFQENYGQSIGIALQEASNTFGNINQPLDVIQSRQLVYHGDPAFSLKSPNKPDYLIHKANINTTNLFDSIPVDMEIHNIGKALQTTLNVSCLITSSEGQLIYNSVKSIDAPFYSNIITLQIPRAKLTGLINIKLTLDEENLIKETVPYGELNNSYSTTYLIKEISPVIVKPIADELLSSNLVSLLFQLPGETNIERIIQVEWDSTPYFNSILGYDEFSESKTLIPFEIPFPDIESSDYYVRVRYIEKGDTSNWAYRTFGIIKNDNEGWTEGNRWKFYNTDLNSIAVDTNTGNFDFLRTTSKDYQIETAGSGLGPYSSRWIIIDGTPVITNWWPFDGVSMIFINPDTDERYHEPTNPFNVPFKTPWFGNTPPPYNVVGEPCAMYNFNTNIIEYQDSMVELLKRIPQGYHIVMLNMSNCNSELWRSELWTALSNFGVSKLQTIKKGEPFAIFGTKGSNQPANEYFADYENSVTLPENQTMKYAGTFFPKLGKGSIVSKTIGPAIKWENLTLNIDEKDHASETFTIKIETSSNRANWTQKLEYTNQKSIDLSNINAIQNPFIRIRIEFNDAVKRTPQSIRRWKINYQKPTDGLVNKDLAFQFHKDTVQQGEPVTLSLSFTNIGNQVFDSSEYVLYIRNDQGLNDTLTRSNLDSIPSQGSMTIRDTISTIDLEGKYDLFVGFNHLKEVQEITYTNNFFNTPFEVLKDVNHPLLDVVFDGNHIIDYDIVSPNTIITMSLKDNNPYLLLNEESILKAYLEHPNGKIDTLTEIMENVVFIPSQSATKEAILRYSAQNLPSGTYKLTVLGNDMSANESSKQGYTIHFEVIQSASITNFFPYPNPASSSVQFVFTLTGKEIPDDIQIQIMTVTGKIVREITRAELGFITIGHNITEFAWDCTDQFGDRLANGVYLYKVKAQLNGETLKIRETSGDHFFTNGIGKLYIIN